MTRLTSSRDDQQVHRHILSLLPWHIFDMRDLEGHCMIHISTQEFNHQDHAFDDVPIFHCRSIRSPLEDVSCSLKSVDVGDWRVHRAEI